MAASDAPGFYEADNDGKAGLDGVFTFRGLAAGLACSGLAFLARSLASSGLGPYFTGLFSNLQLFRDLWSIFIFLSSSGTMK